MMRYIFTGTTNGIGVSIFVENLSEFINASPERKFLVYLHRGNEGGEKVNIRKKDIDWIDVE